MDIPRLRAAGINHSFIEERRQELSTLTRELASTSAEIAQLEASREQAKHWDALAAGRALRGGKKLPPPTHEERLNKRREACRRNRDGFAAAISEIEQEVGTYVSEHADDLVATLAEKERGMNKKQLGALATLQETRSQRDLVLQAARWVSQFVPEAVEESGPPTDHVETHNLNRTNGARPSDAEISRVLAWFKHEAGDSREHEELAGLENDAMVALIDGRGPQPHSFTKRLEAEFGESSPGQDAS